MFFPLEPMVRAKCFFVENTYGRSSQRYSRDKKEGQFETGLGAGHKKKSGDGKSQAGSGDVIESRFTFSKT